MIEDSYLILMLVGKKLKKQRILLGLTQAQVAQSGGFHRAYVGSIERGQQNLTLLKLMKICITLKLKASEVVTDSDQFIYEPITKTN